MSPEVRPSLDVSSNQNRRLTVAYGFLILIAYLILQPSFFGPATNTFAKGMETHALVTQILRYTNEFASLGDPVVRMWYGEFDIHHNPHMNVNYPFYFTWLGSYGDLISSNHRVFLITHLHHMIGGLGAFVFAKAIGARTISAFAAGLFFALCLSNTYMAPFFTRMASSNWTPWGLAAVWLAASGKAPRAAIAIGVPSIALLAFASSAQPLLYFAVTAAFVGSAALYQGYREFGETSEFTKRCIVPSIALVVLSLCLALPATLPVLLEQSEYVRWTTDGPVRGSYKVSYEATLLQSFSGADGLRNLFIPIAKDFNIGTTFIGPIFGFLILAAISFKKKRVLALSLLFLSIYFIINGMGQTTFLPKLTYKFPLLNNVRQLTSHYAVVNFAYIALIAICFDYLIEYGAAHRKRIIATAIVIALIVVLLLRTNQGPMDKLPSFYTWSLLAVPLVVIGFTFTKHQKLQQFVLLILAVAIVLPSAGLRSNDVIDIKRTKFYKVDTHADVLRSWEKISKLDPNAVVATYLKSKERGFHARRINSAAVFYGLQPFYAIMSPRPYESFKHVRDLSRKPENLLERGVQYFLSNQPEKKFNPNRFERIDSVGSFDIYKARQTYGRLNRFCDIFPKKNKCDFDLNIVDQNESNTEFIYDIEASKPQVLAFYGYKNDHWSGYLDGEPLNLKWAGQDQIRVKVPAGNHTIRFKYEDKRQKVLWWIFIVGIFLTLIYLKFFPYKSGKETNKAAPVLAADHTVK